MVLWATSRESTVRKRCDRLDLAMCGEPDWHLPSRLVERLDGDWNGGGKHGLPFLSRRDLGNWVSTQHLYRLPGRIRALSQSPSGSPAVTGYS